MPRRAVANSGPRPIHLIRHEVYQETQSASFGGLGGRGHAGGRPPPLDYSMQGYRGTIYQQIKFVKGGMFENLAYPSENYHKNCEHT